MKDIQGIQRGKCNLCECIEYRAPEESGRFRCEYCNHTPIEHVKIVELGKCKNSDCDCDKYSSEDPNSYTDCQYCGCPASYHKGAEALRKPQPPQPQPAQPQPAVTSPTRAGTVPVSAVVMTGYGGGPPQAGMSMHQMGGQAGGVQPRTLATGVLVQTMAHGKCSLPDCPYPRRIEGTKVLDYCSRTCAQKHSAMKSSFHQQKLASAHQAAQLGPLPPSGGPGGLAPGPPPLQTQPAVGTCSKCNTGRANPGQKWCESCYRLQQMQRP